MKICLAGQGAFGTRHLEAMANIPGIEVVTLAGGRPESTEAFAKKWKIPHWTTRPRREPEAARRRGGDPRQPDPGPRRAGANMCMRAGKHVLIEIPMADTLADSERLVQVAKETGVIAMGGHVRRFNPSHQWVQQAIKAGELKIQQMDVQTYFFRRTNMNAAGQPRTWTDHLLWHHACHTVDLFQYQTGELPRIAHAVQGPMHPELKIAMDMSIQLKVPVGRDPDAVAVVQQQGAARLVLPLHLRQRHLPGLLRRSLRRRQQQDRSVQGRCVDERHRARGPRILRRDQGEARAEVERRPMPPGDAHPRPARARELNAER